MEGRCLVPATHRRSCRLSKCASPNDPLFLRFAPSVMRELHGTNAGFETLSDESLHQLFCDIQELPFLRTRGPSVPVPRWTSSMTASKWMTVAPRTDATEGEHRCEATHTALLCSDDEACQRLEGIVETANAGECESLLGMDVVQECFKTSDGARSTSYCAPSAPRMLRSSQ